MRTRCRVRTRHARPLPRARVGEERCRPGVPTPRMAPAAGVAVAGGPGDAPGPQSLQSSPVVGLESSDRRGTPAPGRSVYAAGDEYRLRRRAPHRCRVAARLLSAAAAYRTTHARAHGCKPHLTDDGVGSRSVPAL